MRKLGNTESKLVNGGGNIVVDVAWEVVKQIPDVVKGYNETKDKPFY
ncbi:hypothetical protein JCM2421_01630 [Staphylococcus auricularis]|uniref:Bacteriocin n=1 Tax=Staphylococcus auricularis TaxID=29379 RepID=A0AAW7MCJ8_9STAP|nr:hypothetical protein [Staphylococcus auricularis]MDC6327280.1 hypothetical protein [Staphylococcus auricularis]MDN4533006.1 hypothetical protein [Staphylococcus auricularis]QPT06083.1 hypothetical protein I6G39_10485 [Staphylococcus auricularis]SQJ06484.1 Uncharacterised protein [Staphylococcus auricularis]BCU51391.1 hypothetical protein JCM2421_01630 [Staphylococcus auricularis]